MIRLNDKFKLSLPRGLPQTVELLAMAHGRWLVSFEGESAFVWVDPQ